jgi:hypothetical protein
VALGFHDAEYYGLVWTALAGLMDLEKGRTGCSVLVY